MCCLGTAVMAGVGDAYTTTVIPAKAGIQRCGATGRRSFLELGWEGLERMGRMGVVWDGTAVMAGGVDWIARPRAVLVPHRSPLPLRGRGDGCWLRRYCGDVGGWLLWEGVLPRLWGFELGCERMERIGVLRRLSTAVNTCPPCNDAMHKPPFRTANGTRGRGGFQTRPLARDARKRRVARPSPSGGVHNVRHSGESRNPEGKGNGEAPQIRAPKCPDSSCAPNPFAERRGRAVGDARNSTQHL